MATLQQLRSRVLDLLKETSSDTHFTDSQLNGHLNHATEYMATLSSPPEDLVDIAVEENIGRYALPTDTLVIQSVYFGTTLNANDIFPLKASNKTLIKEQFPGWLDETSGAAGDPQYYLKLDKNTIYIHPRPNADNVGKRIFLFYGYVPTPMVADGDEPEISNSYHNVLPFFALRLCYLSLSNPVMAAEMYKSFVTDYAAIKDNVDKEVDENFRFKWTVSE